MWSDPLALRWRGRATLTDMRNTTPTQSVRVRWAAIGAAVAVSLGGTTIGIVNATSSSGERAVFVAITPCRLFDTRATEPVGPRTTPLAAGETFQQAVRGTNGNCVLPSDAVAVAMNVTAVNGTSASYLTVWPSDAARPLASSLNWVAGAPPTPNKVDVKLGADGAIKLFNNAGNVDVLADVVGYYVDHNHDDRYPKKVQRLVIGTGMFEAGVGLTYGLDNINDCISSNGQVVAPFSLPVGTIVRSVDAIVYDDAGVVPFTVAVHRVTAQGPGAQHALVDSVTSGDSPAVTSHVVTRHIDLPAGSVVGENVSFEVRWTDANVVIDNALCQVTVEYELP